jgi:beta-galactosidase
MRSPISRSVALAVFVLISVPCLAPLQAREAINLDVGWKFFAGDAPRASDAAFDDASWEAIKLPHTWNAQDGQDGGGTNKVHDAYRRGAGWYRRILNVDAALAGKKLYLQFDGASLKAEVFVNGTRVGEHVGGFARFRFDVTDLLKTGADNVVAVRVDNGNLGIPPNDADFTFFGGLYRSVSLLATDRVQISTTDYASAGVYLTQQYVSAEKAVVHSRTLVENHETSSQRIEVHASVIAPDGAVVRTHRGALHLQPRGRAQIIQPLEIASPRLWNGRADPALYTVRVELHAGGTLRDVVTQPLGLRTVRFDAEKGFFLNGRYLDLVGANRHQDRVDKGWAIGEAEEAEDMALILELGSTALRVAHYQQSETWYDRCDRAGLIVWAEIPYLGDTPNTPYFVENARQQLRELIRQNFNHPSIVCWGVGNEVRDDVSIDVLGELARVVIAEDTTRPSVYASDHRNNDPRNFQTELIAFNRYYGWYKGTYSDFGAQLDDMRRDYPQAIIGISEYGAGGSINHHQENPPMRAPTSKFHPEEYQTKFHEASWRVLKTRPYVWSKFIWNMFDFASDWRDEGDRPGRNDKGLVTYDRKVRKDAFFFYKANWSKEPVLYITSRRYTPRAVAQTEVKIYSNLPAVELLVNGASLGTREPDGERICRWPDVTLQPGENKIEVRAKDGARTLVDTCTWELDPAKAPPVPEK